MQVMNYPNGFITDHAKVVMKHSITFICFMLIHLLNYECPRGVSHIQAKLIN